MAIDMKRYIDIKSGVVSSTLAERDLQGLVFTTEDMVAGATGKSDYDAGTPLKLSLADITDRFAAESDIIKFATKYFSYVGPGSSAPSRLTVAKMLSPLVETTPTLETPLQAFTRVDNLTNDFGSFTFIDPSGTNADPFSAASLAAVAEANAGLDFKYLFCQGFTADDARKATFIGTGTGSLKGIAGTHMVQGYDKYAAAMPMAITASVNYNRQGAATCMMYKQFANETATVTGDSDADTLDAAKVNYYGQTQTNGTKLSFYQRGFNADGTDTMVYFNEIWLKSTIATAFFNLVTSVNKIPADENGRNMVYGIVTNAVGKALNNGTIIFKQSLTVAQESMVLALSGNDEDAPNEVLNNGYWLDVVIQTTDSVEYKAVYTLIYSKGDSIRKVEGYNLLV